MIIARCHADAHVITSPSAAESEQRERSSTTARPSSRSPGVVGPSNMPRRSPSQSRCSARATGAHLARRARVRVVTSRSAIVVGRPEQQRRPPPAASGSASSRVELAQRLAQRALLLGFERALERAARQRAKQVQLAVPAGVARDRVEPDVAARREPDRLLAERAGQRRVLALRVRDPRDAAEQRLAVQVGLDERRLAGADLAGDEQVRVADDPLLVEDERVVGERRAVQVDADQRAAAAEAALGDERVDRLGVRGRGAVGVALRAAGRATTSRAAERPCAPEAAPDRQRRLDEGDVLLAPARRELEPRLLRGLLDLLARLAELVARSRPLTVT